jgi:hypothetical protein
VIDTSGVSSHTPFCAGKAKVHTDLLSQLVIKTDKSFHVLETLSRDGLSYFAVTTILTGIAKPSHSMNAAGQSITWSAIQMHRRCKTCDIAHFANPQLEHTSHEFSKSQE